jgi:Tfp pilus assembly protein PilF
MKNNLLKITVRTVVLLYVVLIWQQIGMAADARHYYEKGTDYLREGNLNEAITTLTKAITLKHNYSKAFNNRGLAYYRQNKDIQAEKDFLKAIQFNPKDEKAHNNVAIVLCKQGQYSRALVYLNQAIVLMKETERYHADVYNNLAFVCTKKGMYKEAIEAYNQAHRIIENKNTDFSDGYDGEAILRDQITLDQRIDGHPLTAKFYGK